MFLRLITLFFLSTYSFIALCQKSLLAQTDSAKHALKYSTNDQESFIKSCFFIADNYMDLEQYDSAQIWLDKIHDKIPAKKPSLFNYFLLSRQAEVYYYNNLQQLGLQQSYRGLEVAQILKDSFLIADSYNFLGLFYMNLDSVRQSIQFYKKGIQYLQKTPYPSKYFSLSKPHHLYGNLSEAYFKINHYNDARLFNKISLEKAYENNFGRGIAVGYTSAGDIYYALQMIDSSMENYLKGKKAAYLSKDVDVELLCYGGMAKCFNKLDNYEAAKKQLAEAFIFLNDNPSLNPFFALQFLNTAIEIYRQKNDFLLLSKALEVKSVIEMGNVRTNNSQVQTILKASVENEKRLLSLEVTEANQKQKLANTRLLFALSALLILALVFLLYRNVQKEKLKAARIRQKISHDLHDDIGASLSSLQIYGSIAEQTIESNPKKAIEMVHKISTQSKLLMENMNDIVWSMKSGMEDSTTLEAKIKDFGVELLSDKNISFTYKSSQEVEVILQSIQARKNILLLIKEALNNIAKYSKASKVVLDLQIIDKQLKLEIRDDGIGFDPANVVVGNGLKNMEYRVQELKGIIKISSVLGNGTEVIASIPTETINKSI